jgi:hypothetical protein
MLKELSKFSRTVLLIFVVLVVFGLLLTVPDGLGGIYLIPLLIPWVIIDIILYAKYGNLLPETSWLGPLRVAIYAALNTYILYMILRARDRRRARIASSTSPPQSSGPEGI